MSLECVLPVWENKYMIVCAVPLCISALAVACFIARRMHVWSYSGFATLVPCRAKVALLPLQEKAISFGYIER
jgi:hypothetical protein